MFDLTIKEEYLNVWLMKEGKGERLRDLGESLETYIGLFSRE